MVPSARAAFNANFTQEKYQSFLKGIQAGLLKPIEFRLAETPVFIGAKFRDMLIEAGNDIIETILRTDFKQITEKAIPERWNVPNENDHPHFIALDFGVCADADGKLVPKLIEMQGFPSLYGFQAHQGHQYQKTYGMPDADQWSIYFNGLDDQSYIELLKKTILGPYQPDEVVLMDVDAYNQKTVVDFLVTQNYLGIPIVALEELKQLGNQLFYELDGELKLIKRIYNRLIFDEIENNEALLAKVVDVRQPLDVEWITHPNWFYRISKYTMPFLKGDYIPKTYFLDQLETIPADLENYVLKPLFSFAGQGVIIDLKQSDIDAIGDKHNWILQQKVNYEPAVQAPDGGVKAEIRLLYLWPDGDAQPTLAINLARLSRGKMIGVRYNKDFDWVGGTVAFMEK
jgi:glutathionylspermidine synthase